MCKVWTSQNRGAILLLSWLATIGDKGQEAETLDSRQYSVSGNGLSFTRAGGLASFVVMSKENQSPNVNSLDRFIMSISNDQKNWRDLLFLEDETKQTWGGAYLLTKSGTYTLSVGPYKCIPAVCSSKCLIETDECDRLTLQVAK
jgi:hypothetical protein